jgi:MFS family permease
MAAGIRPGLERGWVSGLSIGLLPLGPLLAALLSASLGAVIGWRGLFAIGLVPAALAFVIRIWIRNRRAGCSDAAHEGFVLLTKPFQMTALEQVIRSALEQRSQGAQG